MNTILVAVFLCGSPLLRGRRGPGKGGTFCRSCSVAAVVTALVCGCASLHHGLVLDPVGPPPAPTVAAGATGSLLVFSAFDPTPPSTSNAYRRWHTDYKILSSDGQLLMIVHNDNGVLLEGPKKVTLLPGAYKVVARANGYGKVTVPVIIRPSQVTAVHLEGTPSWPQKAALTDSNAVRLPDGQIAGWRASPTGN